MAITTLSKSFKRLSFFATVLVVSLALGNFVFAVWTEPGAAPPDDNASAPINVSTTDQTKPARLDVSSLYDADNGLYYINPSATATPSGVFAGSVGIGMIDPVSVSNKLNVSVPLYVFQGPVGAVAAAALPNCPCDLDFNVQDCGNQHPAPGLDWECKDEISLGSAWNKFKSEYSNSLTVTPEGRVGIGTSDPQDTLHIKHNAEIILEDTSSAIYFLDTNDYDFGIRNRTGILEFLASSNLNGLNDLRQIAATKMVMHPDGSVGIGDESPDGGLKLDVEGKVGATDYCNEDGSICTPAASLGGGGGFWTENATDDIYNNNASGYIGIGKTDPDSRLHIVGDTDANIPKDARISVQNINGGSKKSEVCFLRPDTSAGGWCMGTDLWNQEDDDFYIWGGGLYGGESAGRLYINSIGDVGLGTHFPVGRLDVSTGRIYTYQQTVVATIFPACNCDTTANEDCFDGDFVAVDIIGSQCSDSIVGGWKEFIVEDNNLFVVKKDGDVGIGTSDPQALLHVRGIYDLANDPPWWYGNEILFEVDKMTVKDGSAAIHLETTKWQGNPHLNWKLVGNSGIGKDNRLIISSYDDEETTINDRFTINGINGNVGIGTDPATKLDVNGGIKGNDYFSGDGSQGLTRNVTVKGSDGNNCVLTFKDGLLTAETCP